MTTPRINFLHHSIKVSLLQNNFSYENLSLVRMCLLSLPLAGVQFCLQAMSVMGSSYFYHVGFSTPSIRAFRAILPICGLLLVPIVGHYSDTCTHRWGRRRPFILLAGVLCALGLLLLVLGHEFSSIETAMGVMGFIFTSCGIWTMHASVRPQLSDLGLLEQQELVQAVLAFASAIGDVLAAIVLVCDPLPSSDQIILTLSVAAVLVLLTSFVNLLLAPEISLKGVFHRRHRPTSIVRAHPRAVSEFLVLPTDVRGVALVQFLGWLTLACVMVPLPSYMFERSDQSERMGVRLAKIALLSLSALEVVTCFLIPYFARPTTIPAIFFVSFLLTAFTCVLLLVVSAPASALVALALLGVAFACIRILPFSVTGRHFWKGNRVGSAMSSLIVLSCLGEGIALALWEVLTEEQMLFVAIASAVAAMASSLTLRPRVATFVRDDVMV